MDILGLFDYWLPILVSTILMFVASWIVHTVLRHHKNDYRKLGDEDEVMSALRNFGLKPGNYVMPYAGSMEAMRSEEYAAKCEKGPMAMMTIMNPGRGMGRSLGEWFVFMLVTTTITACIADSVLADGNPQYMEVFKLVGWVMFMCHGMGQATRSIWFHQEWSTTFKNMFDAAIYALLTAGTFGWLWPS
ncbi:MAG: hypothetical protein J4G03_03055 [Gemmatimonadetes bacterium]|nr:hypothetical protein [Gemmatimonadota bacterium]